MNPTLLATTSQDGTTRIWDHVSANLIWEIRGHQPGSEVLTMDWNKYKEFELATAGTDRNIILWDTRNLAHPMSILGGHHQYAIRRIRYSPFEPNLLASVSYDMSLAVWNSETAGVMMRYDAHTEFVFGVTWSLFEQGRIATCSWDRSVHVLRL